MQKPAEFKNLSIEVPIIGFTGALGSGCSFFAETLALEHRYVHHQLSQAIRREAKRRGQEPTVGTLQDIGNDLRRKHGLDHLVLAALKKANGSWKRHLEQGKVGIILDGIRNAGEVQTLRQFPHFYLVSVHAEVGTRRQRLLADGKFASEDEFDKADARDAEEPTPNGQQVRRCNYASDIIIVNEKPIPENMPDERKAYVHDKLYKNYVTLIERRAHGQTTDEHRPNDDEGLMTLAYCESKRSRCLKRRVGAVIALGGVPVAASHNDVPPGIDHCMETEDGRCFRDKIQEDAAKRIRHCPACGKRIALRGMKCVACNRRIHDFVKQCPNPQCKKDPQVRFTCKCGNEVFEVFLPGKGQSGKLLDICRAIHAEENAILTLGRMHAIAPKTAVLYTTTFPCNLCANTIAALGIFKELVYAEPYSMKEAEDILKKKSVGTRRFEGVKSEAYFRLYG
jgi:deoxycytidylate deaminase/dephospho-CoA kinase